MGMKGKIEVTDPSVQVAQEVSDPFHVWPNPFSDKIFVKGMKDIDIIEIYDVTGSTIYRAVSVPNENMPVIEINPGELAPGFYFMVIRQGDEVHYRKLVRN
jgi:hypothetical protein